MITLFDAIAGLLCGLAGAVTVRDFQPSSVLFGIGPSLSYPLWDARGMKIENENMRRVKKVEEASKSKDHDPKKLQISRYTEGAPVVETDRPGTGKSCRLGCRRYSRLGGLRCLTARIFRRAGAQIMARTDLLQIKRLRRERRGTRSYSQLKRYARSVIVQVASLQLLALVQGAREPMANSHWSTTEMA